MLFRNGIEYEREGNYNEATRYYKRALKLDPDVEKKIADEETASQSMDTCKNIISCLWSIYGMAAKLFPFMILH